MCRSRKYPYSPPPPPPPPQKGVGIFRGGGVFVKTKNLKKCVKFYWNFKGGEGGGGVLEKIPSVEEVWIFSGATQ